MKGAVPAFLCIILMTTASSAAVARKLARNGSQHAVEKQAEQATEVDGRPSSGYGEHVCPRNLFPSCAKRMEQAASNNLG
ncbi:hypothetical protein ACP70R_009352 [Stipagrostis hirtigluma subsp. patula]